MYPCSTLLFGARPSCPASRWVLLLTVLLLAEDSWNKRQQRIAPRASSNRRPTHVTDSSLHEGEHIMRMVTFKCICIKGNRHKTTVHAISFTIHAFFFLHDLKPHCCINILFHKKKRALEASTPASRACFVSPARVLKRRELWPSVFRSLCVGRMHIGFLRLLVYNIDHVSDERHHFRCLILVRLKVRCDRLGNTLLDEWRALTTPEGATILLFCGCDGSLWSTWTRSSE